MRDVSNNGPVILGAIMNGGFLAKMPERIEDCLN